VIVPFLDLAAATAELRPEISRAIDEVVASGRFVLGPQVEAFESEFAAYVEAAHGIGVSQRRLIWTHLLPNSIGPVITQSAMTVSWAIMVIAGISYLGFGIQPPTPEWGLMISEGAGYMTSGEWWVSFFPGVAILSIVAALMLIDDGLKDES
jgi:ABC-type dipeptide/oligopeptide/nickel transport system permease subunit